MTEPEQRSRVGDATPIGPIHVRVPPEPSLSQVLRLAASGLASLAGFTIDEIEKIKVAVSDVLIALIDHGGGAPIDVQLEIDGRSFNVSARTNAAAFDPDHPDLQLSRVVLAEVTDQYDIAIVGDQAQIWAAVTDPRLE